MKHWYLIYTKPRQEVVAINNLENQGYTVFSPMISVRKRTAQGWKVKEEALFPNYVFIHLSTEAQEWRPIRSTKGVSGFVKFNQDFPEPVNASVMDALLSMDIIQVSEYLSQYPKVGDRVELSIGNAFVSALVQAVDGHSRVLVLFSLLGKTSESWVNADTVTQTLHSVQTA